MTLIASVNYNGSPVLIGDLLLSGQGKTIPTVDLPTLGSIDSYEDVIKNNAKEDHAQVGLVQKVNMLSENLAIAWSGDYVRALSILKILRTETYEKDLSYDLVRGILSDNRDITEDRVSLIGILREPCGGALAFYQNAKMIDLPRYKEFIFAGKGSNQYYTNLYSVFPGNTDVKNKVPGLNRFPHELFDPAGTAWRLLAMETVSGNTVFNHYGGGFEVAYISREEGLKKIDDVAHYCWLFDLKDISKPPILWNGITKYNYMNEDLIISRVLPLDTFEKFQNVPVLEKQYRVKPMPLIQREVYKGTFEVDYSAKWTCNHFYVGYNKEKFSLLTSTVYSDTRTPSVKAEVRNGYAFIDLDMDYMQKCHSEFRQHVAEEIAEWGI
jgi:hypothetical protein